MNFTIKEPYGVVAAIVPFNFPLLLMAWKVAPARWRATRVVCKPPHQNPLSNLRWPRLRWPSRPAWSTSSPEGPRPGELLVEHPGVDLIAFTGSVAVGRGIAAPRRRGIKKVNLELAASIR